MADRKTVSDIETASKEKNDAQTKQSVVDEQQGVVSGQTVTPDGPIMNIQVGENEKRVQPIQLGERLKELRLSQNLTLEEASQRTGLARSTLSKIENEQISPTFQALQKLAAGLGLDIPQIFAPPEEGPEANGRRDITRDGAGKPHPTTTYEHELLAVDISRKKMMPFKCTVRARRFEDFDGWVRHEGEEFLLVLTGAIAVYTEFYEPVTLKEGDSMYYDARMGHCLVSVSDTDAQVLWVTAP
ncbi:helix-turn-helix domain-containing protein [Marinibactrum halimedae]|uniref:Transcriptional regulator n=1 Tax=Marinibactrum halimedae TaxID=1444977 RepID=A0AA37T5Y8_9GAMM|nr:helix-turn-helix domain-containing protein [Marinibactrum halimedae]MCD9457593.1 helix-turn-helix domain-containing protein [Marinibactrum halimedae]GLS28013.1 transcriptional regulator [Marinibactrum halimedae]